MADSFRFQPFGRTPHLRIDTPADLRHAAELDEAHWVATNAPIETLACDPGFLAALDFDGNGRIMCYELRRAIRWLFAVLSDPCDVQPGSTTLRLAAVDPQHPDGQRVLTSSRKMLDRLGTPGAERLTLQELRGIKAEVEAMPVSEAGVVLPSAADELDLRTFLRDVLATVGGAAHPSGKLGVDATMLEAFLQQAHAHLAWWDAGQLPEGQDSSPLLPLGEATSAAWEAYEALRAKVDQFFAQCEAALLDSRLVTRMGWTEAELEGLDFDDPEVIEQVLSRAPLAQASSARELRLDEGLNPHYAEAAARFRAQVLVPLLGGDGVRLGARQWQELKRTLAPHERWVRTRPETAVASLGIERLRRYTLPDYADRVRRLLESSEETALVLDNIRLTERLVMYQAYLLTLANNFISFPHLYNPRRRALFEMGSLIMDGRRFNLAVRVRDRKAHVKVAKTSNMYVMYVQVRPRGGAPPYELAVPVTCGGRGNLCVGKRGVFQDLQGDEHDAAVVHVIENPISLAEALLAPLKRLVGLVAGRIESLADDAEKRLDSETRQAVDGVYDKASSGRPKAPAAAAPAPAAPRKAAGSSAGNVLMGSGVALAALGSAVAYIGKTLAGLGWAKVLAGLGAAVLAVVVPSSVAAFLKLRSRDLSAILEGSGWGINARMRLTFRQGRVFTRRPARGRRQPGPAHALPVPEERTKNG